MSKRPPPPGYPRKDPWPSYTDAEIALAVVLVRFYDGKTPGVVMDWWCRLALRVRQDGTPQRDCFDWIQRQTVVGTVIGKKNPAKAKNKIQRQIESFLEILRTGYCMYCAREVPVVGIPTAECSVCHELACAICLGGADQDLEHWTCPGCIQKERKKHHE